uniref:Uncharacterized protein n=1 Tax=Amphimedon queenslandica TaxID=400682 RepID=A0A1X7SNG1_AMPQE
MNIQGSQQRGKKNYDKKVFKKELKIGDWTLVRFPQEESGKQRKLSKPWHGPYRITHKTETGVTVVPIHFPESGSIQVHMSRVTPCPPKWPLGFYWYGGKRLSRGKTPSWVERLLETGVDVGSETVSDAACTSEPAGDDEVINCLDEEAVEEGQPRVDDEDIQEQGHSEDVPHENTEVEPPETAGQYNLRPRTGFPLWLVDEPD